MFSRILKTLTTLVDEFEIYESIYFVHVNSMKLRKTTFPLKAKYLYYHGCWLNNYLRSSLKSYTYTFTFLKQFINMSTYKYNMKHINN
jgi:hypothetical protein